MSEILSSNPYRVEPTHCQCHPETCCCPDYTLLVGDYVVARGGNKGELQKLVDAANGRSVETTDAADAAKWRALRDCSRITAMGCAGLTQPHNADDDYAHLTLNFWTGIDDGDPGPAYAREWLDKFVAKALRPAVKANAEPVRSNWNPCRGRDGWDCWTCGAFITHKQDVTEVERDCLKCGPNAVNGPVQS